MIRGFFASREQAQRAIMAGEVKIGTRVAAKASESLTEDADVHVASAPKFVGRGGLKLEGALDLFGIDVRDKIALDIGASTGGFTDCLLQRGVTKVYAVDVGHDQLAWKIRSDPRVIVFEKVNARSLSREQIPEDVDLCVIDVSFISLTLILPPAFELLKAGGLLLALIKPQFELARADVGRADWSGMAPCMTRRRRRLPSLWKAPGTKSSALFHRQLPAPRVIKSSSYAPENGRPDSAHA